jgi:hypothetical protein
MVVLMAAGASLSAFAQGNPLFRVNPVNEHVWGHQWPAGNLVVVALGDPGEVIGMTAVDASGDWHLNFDEHGRDILAGDLVTVSDGVTMISHTVTVLTVTQIDSVTDSVLGTAEPESWVGVAINAENGAYRSVQANAQGEWTADFSSEFDIQPGTSGGAFQEDDTSQPFGSTYFEWYVAHPRFRVDVADHNVWGEDWPPGETIAVTRMGEPNVDLGTTDASEWGSWSLSSIPYELQPGDLLRAECASVTKEHQITGLTITEIDASADAIVGSTAPGSWVVVMIWDNVNSAGRAVQADGDGLWTADFSVGEGDGWDRAFDLQPEDEGSAWQEDEDGDATEVYWRIDRPQFTVDPASDDLWGSQWPAGGTVAITLLGETNVVIGTTEVGEWGDWCFGSGDLDIVAGNSFLIECEGISKQHTVTDIALVDVDPGADAISGTAVPETWVLVTAWSEAGVAERFVQAGMDGSWVADFTDPVNDGQDWDQALDLQPGDTGEAWQEDDDGDSTHLNWVAEEPRPIIQVQPSSHDFGFVDLGASRTQRFAVVNAGKLPLEIGAVTLTNGTDLVHFSIVSDSCSSQTLAPRLANTGTVTVVFAPISTWGKAVRLLFPSNDPEHPLYEVRIYGSGRSASEAEARFLEGLDALASYMGGAGGTNALIEANDLFGQALATDPDHYGAALFRLITRIETLPYDPDVASMLSDFGIPEAGRDIFDWMADLPDTLPTNSLLSRAVHTLGAELEDVIAEGLANLGRVPADWPGSIIFSPDQLPIDNEVQVDAGDVQMIQGVLCLAKGLLCMIRAHDLGFDLADLNDPADPSAPDTPWSVHLDHYPSMGTITNVALFASATNWFINAIDFYNAGSSLIRAETDYQPDDLIVLDPEGLADENFFRQTLAQVRDSLAGRVSVPFKIELSEVLDLGYLFSHPASLRDLVGGSGLQEALGSVLLVQIDRALENLGGVDDTFGQTLSPDDFPVSRTIEVDHGDVWMARAWLNGWKALIHIAQAYNLDDADIVKLSERDPLLINDVRAEYPSILNVTNEPAMAPASSALAAAMDAYSAGSLFLHEHASTRANDVFAILGNQWLLAGDVLATDESAFSRLVQDLRSSLSGPVLIDSGNHSFFEHVNLGRFFVPTFVTRAHLPDFDAANRAVSGTFPDTTFNGIFPAMTSQWHLADRLGLEMADTDGGGLPDLWQNCFFGHLGVNPKEDTDKDGLRNEQELWAGTDPTDDASGLELIRASVQRQSGVPLFEIRWPSVPYRDYAVESATDPTGRWTVEIEVPATPHTNVYTDDSPISQPKYYRIRLVE